MTVGSGFLQNSAASDAVIEQVKLPSSASNLVLVEARIGRAEGDVIGTALGYPPRDLPAGSQTFWDATVLAEGARVPADESLWSLIVGLSLSTGAVAGETDGIEVHYTSDGRSHVYTTNFRIALGNPCSELAP